MEKKTVDFTLRAELKTFVDKETHIESQYWSYRVLVEVPVLGVVECPITIKDSTARDLLTKVLQAK